MRTIADATIVTDQVSPGNIHISERAARGATCYFGMKVGHFERTCRAKGGN